MKVRLLGDRHPDTALTMYNLAVLLYERGGGMDEARNLATLALESLRVTLPDDHPHVTACLTFVSSAAAS
jgi:hypothetical protein